MSRPSKVFSAYSTRSVECPRKMSRQLPLSVASAMNLKCAASAHMMTSIPATSGSKYMFIL
eukprot:CAMPEP_0178381400 /NCGR_PEP_ID=MMETSP0689_2-20121128/5963_1 /TAXON_ID=160604 /ORGANISM="Amphidinium massartii, Strain CS-259" /LENGTH=60 /DNA_ID=CAMNT_0020001581 /DNA_START=535 /DNA_END=717 /DNA_ORIENTATION=-